MPMSDINVVKYPCCLSLQVLDKNRGKTDDRSVSIFS